MDCEIINMATKKKKPEELKHTTKKPLLEINKEFLDKVYTLSGQGFNNENLYHYFQVSETTWYKYKENNPEIERAIKNGKCQFLEIATNVMREGVLSGDRAWTMFYLKTQHGFNETKNINAKVETPGEKSTTELKITTTDPIEASRIYQQFMMTTAGS
jgi:hypothetical protein